MFPWRHLLVFRIVRKQKRRAKQRDELDFSRVPYSDPKQKRASARDSIQSGGRREGGGGTNNRFKNDNVLMKK